MAQKVDAALASHTALFQRAVIDLGVWGATEQKTGLSTGCRQPLDRRDVNIERLGAVPYILSLVQLVELPGRPNCTSRFLATLRARVGCASVPAQLSRPELGQSSCSIFAQVLAKRLGFARYCCEREFPYIEANQNFIPNYGDRYRHGE